MGRKGLQENKIFHSSVQEVGIFRSWQLVCFQIVCFFKHISGNFMVRLLMMKGVTWNVFSNHAYVESVSGKRGASS